jgi:hypothetical protein
MYIENVKKELMRVAQIVFQRGTSEELEQLMETLDALQTDAMMYHQERQKEENE